MNIDIFAGFLSSVRKLESQYQVQAKLDAFASAFADLNANSADPERQKAFKAAQDQLWSSVGAIEAALDPKSAEIVEEIGGNPWFTSELIQRLSAIIDANRITLAIASEEITKFSEERKQFVATLIASIGNLKKLGITEYHVEIDEPEVGFEIPRDIFNNELPEFRKELLQIQLIVKSVQRLHGLDSAPIQISTISTTDPLIYIQVVWPVLVTIGGLITWTLDTLERGIRIKSAWDQTNSAGLIDKAKIEKFFKPEIEAAVSAAIDAKITTLLTEHSKKSDKELKALLNTVLKALLSRVERGMRVDLRFSLPPAEPEEGSGQDDAYADIRPLATKAREIQARLKTKLISSEPILALEFLEDETPGEAEEKENPVKKVPLKKSEQ